MTQQKTIVAARYVRNSDPSKKDSEVQKTQSEALERFGLEQGYECPENLLYADAISALKYPYWERKMLMQMLDDAEAHRFEDTTEGRLLHAIQGFLGEVEAAKIQIRTQRGKRHRAERGLTGQGKYPMYGYTWIDGQEYTRQRYVLNLEVIHVDATGKRWTQVSVLQFCFYSYNEGMSLRQIALTLTRLGVPTQRGRDAWDQATISQFLKNICYTGEEYNGRFSKLENGGPIKLANDIFPRIIEPEVFEETQKQLRIHQEMSIRNNHHPHVGILRGLAFCGICGYKMQEKHYERYRHNKMEIH